MTAVANTANKKYLNRMKRWLLGDVVVSNGPSVRVSRSGALTVDRDSLHSSRGYARQVTALQQLEKLDKKIHK
jgi:hypothetical protein